MNSVDDRFIELVWQGFLALSGWEAIAALLGVTYVILATRESIWCWPAAFTSTLIYTLLFWEGQLPMQSLLHIYYMAMALYGWRSWRANRQTNQVLVITSKSVQFHALFITAGVALSLMVAYYLEQNVASKQPYLDAFVTVFAVMNTVLIAKKVLEAWLYWIVIDSAAIVLYFQTGYYVTIVMFMLYLVLAAYGYKNWRALKEQANVT